MLDLAPCLTSIWYAQAKHSSPPGSSGEAQVAAQLFNLSQTPEVIFQGITRGRFNLSLRNMQRPGLSITSVGHASRGAPGGTRTFAAHFCAAVESLVRAPGALSLIFLGHLLISEVTLMHCSRW